MMGIVIDINTLSPVFNEKNICSKDFQPVKQWIDGGRGFLVFGGSKYKEELTRAGRYLRIINEMTKVGQAIAISDELVDETMNSIIEKTSGTGCDDHHIIAILIVSRCYLCCTQDVRSHKHIKNKDLYPEDMVEVKIYSSKDHMHLLKPVSRDKIKNQI